MADDIVERLRVIHCAADDLTPCGTCLPCQAADEIERLRAAGDALQVLLRGRTAEFLAEIERLRSEQYIDGLGVDWCVLHHGVRNEDSNHCDAFNWDDGDDMLDEDGEYLPCDLRPLAYREAPRG